MKMYLMTFDKACETFACETFGKKHPTEIDFSKGYVFGIGKDSIPWGENVEVDIETLDNSNNLSTYELNGYFVPTCMFKVDDTNLDKEPSANDILCSGTILTDDELYDHYYPMDKYVRIRIIAYNGIIYYHKMVNGEVVEFKKVGVMR